MIHMACRGLCDEIGILGASYNDGVKYCRKCEVFIFYEGIFCPCCHLHLRTSPIRKIRK